MESLTKSQKDEYATSYAILALFDGGADITSDQVNTLLQATGNTDVEAFYPIIFANYLSNAETLGKLIAIPGSGSGGGGGGGGGGGDAGAEDAQEEAKVEEKEEEEEMDMAGGIDMFGGDDEGGGGGDY
ncbi:60s Acidic ribosomal protein [Fragilaria crotonensis]|nr:60s Acidic ribosomal protein [Fragilaria crotonensis]